MSDVAGVEHCTCVFDVADMFQTLSSSDECNQNSLPAFVCLLFRDGGIEKPLPASTGDG